MRKIICFLPLILLLAVVFLLSSQPRDQQTIVPFLTRHVPQDLLSALLPDVRVRYGHIELDARASPYHFTELIFRKSAHIILYTSVGLALYAATFGTPLRRGRPVAKWLAVLAGMAVIAAFDEWNQSRVPMRSGLILDVWLDVIGGMLGTWAVIGLRRRIIRTRRDRHDFRISPSGSGKPQG